MNTLITRCEETKDKLMRIFSLPQERLLNKESGKIGWAILWLLGIPLPVLLIAYLIWGR